MDHVDDMCEPKEIEVTRAETGLQYWDDNNGHVLNPRLVAKAEEEELLRFRHMHVYDYVDRDQAMADEEGIFRPD